MNKTNIEWVKNPDGTQGYTWNPITGCLNGCEYCYARKLANTRLRELYLANTNLAPDAERENWPTAAGNIDIRQYNPFHPRLWPEKLVKGLPSGKPKGIFVCDMSDLFGKGIPESWTWQVLRLIKFYSQHRFYLLTKQPQNLIKFSPFPDNCWVGVSADNTERAMKSIDLIDQVKARVKFLSIEPLLSWDTASFIYPLKDNLKAFNWLIIGTQTKPYKPPKVEWVREIFEAADRAGVPVFLKDNLEPLLGQSLEFVRWYGKDENGNNLHGLRQKMPEVKDE